MKPGQKSVVLAAFLGGACLFGYVVHDAAMNGRVGLLPKALADEARTCAVHTLKGVYGIKFEGLRLGNAIEHYNSVSRWPGHLYGHRNRAF